MAHFLEKKTTLIFAWISLTLDVWVGLPLHGALDNSALKPPLTCSAFLRLSSLGR